MAGRMACHFTPAVPLGAAAALVVAMAAGCGPAVPGSAHQMARATPSAGAAAFLASYVRADGRVVRPDQGGDTVSEGQAYGLLLAQVAGDRAAFGRIWRWTRTHLQRPDGLFAYHTDATGRVLDAQPASDADLLIAWALLRATGPGAAGYQAAGRRVAAAVLAHETTYGPGGVAVLAAGPWATGRPASLNPSYWSLPALHGLAARTADPRWQRLASGAVPVTRQLTGGGELLPPDWAKLTAAGQLRPEPAPSGGAAQAQYGLDAQRTVVWFAASCDPGARALAARWWPKLRASAPAAAIALHLDGTPLDQASHPLPLVAAASAAQAAGNRPASAGLLRRAVAQQHSYPTYYGAAWAALGPALLTGALPAC